MPDPKISKEHLAKVAEAVDLAAAIKEAVGDAQDEVVYGGESDGPVDFVGVPAIVDAPPLTLVNVDHGEGPVDDEPDDLDTYIAEHPDRDELLAKIAELEAQLSASPEPATADVVLAEDADVSVTAQPDVNGYETILSITGAGLGRHVGSLRLIGPGGHTNIGMDLDFNGPDFTTKLRTEIERGFLRLPGSCLDDTEVVILPKPYDEGI